MDSSALFGMMAGSASQGATTAAVLLLTALLLAGALVVWIKLS